MNTSGNNNNNNAQLHFNRFRETLGPINAKGLSFFNELGRRLSARSGEPRERQFLFQRFSIAVQRFNSICFHGSFSEEAISDHDA